MCNKAKIKLLNSHFSVLRKWYQTNLFSEFGERGFLKTNNNESSNFGSNVSLWVTSIFCRNAVSFLRKKIDCRWAGGLEHSNRTKIVVLGFLVLFAVVWHVLQFLQLLHFYIYIFYLCLFAKFKYIKLGCCCRDRTHRYVCVHSAECTLAPLTNEPCFPYKLWMHICM